MTEPSRGGTEIELTEGSRFTRSGGGGTTDPRAAADSTAGGQTSEAGTASDAGIGSSLTRTGRTDNQGWPQRPEAAHTRDDHGAGAESEAAAGTNIQSVEPVNLSGEGRSRNEGCLKCALRTCTCVTVAGVGLASALPMMKKYGVF
ncbi:hypothetical protein IAU59_007312 [Kwoniella sp. CBS 9459]